MTVASVILVAVSLPVLFWAAYLAVLAILSRSKQEPEQKEPHLRFAIVVPAHDAEDAVETTVRSMRLLDYPQELFDVVVVADDCSDRTVETALRAGAAVLVRTAHAGNSDVSGGLEGAGRARAIKHGFDTLAEGKDAPDAFVVVDPGTTAAPNLLRAFAARLEAGEVAVQAEYGLREPRVSWRTRLVAIALALFHAVRSRARERLGVSTGLRGDGMALSRAALADVAWDADLASAGEYEIRLARAGRRVAYAHEALVRGDVQATEPRWDPRRLVLVRRHVPALLRDAWQKKRLALLDLALDALVPPLSLVAIAALLGSAVALLLGTLAWIPWAAALLCLGVYVVRGVLLSDVGLAGLLDLCWAPLYVAWRLSRGRRKGG